jgi:hypothetical protein
MQLSQQTIQKIQLVELKLSDYLFDAKGYENDPLEDAHCAIISAMRDLKIPFSDTAELFK